MADAAVNSPGDVVDFLVGQHQQIKSLFAQTLSSSGKQRENAFLELRRLLAVHETVEEEIVHPRAKRKLSNGQKVVGARLEEEHEAKTVLAELEKLVSSLAPEKKSHASEGKPRKKPRGRSAVRKK